MAARRQGKEGEGMCVMGRVSVLQDGKFQGLVAQQWEYS